ncbi:MAG: malonyl CoA-acyl carrier protein transacylase, partial [Pseudomonadota bacterium]
AGAVSDTSQIRDNLVAQVTGTVRWRESVSWMVDNGVTGFVEVGAGKVLTGMARRMASDATCMATTSVSDIEAVVQHLNA